MKIGAKKFIDIIDEATDSEQDGQIGFGSHIGIVSFASTAAQDTQLITSVADLKAAVDALAAILTEVDDAGKEYKRELKTVTVPAHNRPSCHKVTI